MSASIDREIPRFIPRDIAIDTQVMKVHDLEQVGQFLLGQKPAICIFDVDGVLKHRALSISHTFRPGELDPLAIPLLEELKAYGWKPYVCTNQYVACRKGALPKLFPGHQVARYLADRFNYAFAPDSLQRSLGENRVWGAPLYLPYFYKSVGLSVSDLTKAIAEEDAQDAMSGVYMTGDKVSDYKFWENIKNQMRLQLKQEIPGKFLQMAS